MKKKTRESAPEWMGYKLGNLGRHVKGHKVQWLRL